MKDKFGAWSDRRKQRVKQEILAKTVQEILGPGRISQRSLVTIFSALGKAMAQLLVQGETVAIPHFMRVKPYMARPTKARRILNFPLQEWVDIPAKPARRSAKVVFATSLLEALQNVGPSPEKSPEEDLEDDPEGLVKGT